MISKVNSKIYFLLDITITDITNILHYVIGCLPIYLSILPTTQPSFIHPFRYTHLGILEIYPCIYYFFLNLEKIMKHANMMRDIEPKKKNPKSLSSQNLKSRGIGENSGIE